jgi:hypothetical protein
MRVVGQEKEICAGIIGYNSELQEKVGIPESTLFTLDSLSCSTNLLADH